MVSGIVTATLLVVFIIFLPKGILGSLMSLGRKPASPPGKPATATAG